MGSLRVNMCGRVQLVADERVYLPVHRVRRGVLAVLALDPGRYVDTEHLITYCWDHTTASAHANLRSHVSHLRSLLESVGRGQGRWLETRRGDGDTVGAYRLLLADESDVAQVRRLFVVLRRELRCGHPESALRHCREAEALWRGDFGKDLPGTQWFRRQAAELTDIRNQTRWSALVARLLLGDTDAVLEDLRPRVSADDLDDRHRAVWTAALALAGDATAAKAAFEDLRARYDGSEVPERLAALGASIHADDHPAMLGTLARWSLIGEPACGGEWSP